MAVGVGIWFLLGGSFPSVDGWGVAPGSVAEAAAAPASISATQEEAAEHAPSQDAAAAEEHENSERSDPELSDAASSRRQLLRESPVPRAPTFSSCRRDTDWLR